MKTLAARSWSVKLGIAALFLLTTLQATAAWPAPIYPITDIGLLAGDYSIRPDAISEPAELVGESTATDFLQHTFYTPGSELAESGSPLGGIDATANGMSRADQDLPASTINYQEQKIVGVLKEYWFLVQVLQWLAVAALMPSLTASVTERFGQAWRS